MKVTNHITLPILEETLLAPPHLAWHSLWVFQIWILMFQSIQYVLSINNRTFILKVKFNLLNAFSASVEMNVSSFILLMYFTTYIRLHAESLLHLFSGFHLIMRNVFDMPFHLICLNLVSMFIRHLGPYFFVWLYYQGNSGIFFMFFWERVS